MDSAPDPSRGALALTALCHDAVISRVLPELDEEEREDLRSASKGVRDACDRQIKKLALPRDAAQQDAALAALNAFVQRGMQLEELNLEGLVVEWHSAEGVAKLL